MTTFRHNIETEILKKRPNLTASSVKTYVSILFNINKKLNPENTDMSFFDNHDEILNLLSSKPAQARKTSLAALYVLTNNNEYSKVMLDDCKTTNTYYKEQKKSVKEEENWVSTDEIKKLYDELYFNASAMLNNKLAIHYQTIVNYMLVACLGGVSGIAPRRSLDFTELKLKNYSKTDNYYKTGKFYFNIYKTSQHYGEQVIDVKQKAPEFYRLLQKWVKINPTDYLLFSSNQQKFTSPQVTKSFNRLFGKRASTNMLRHSYLTDKYGKLQEEMAKDSEMMSHSPSTQALYIKK
jgi:hypothetical protein